MATTESFQVPTFQIPVDVPTAFAPQQVAPSTTAFQQVPAFQTPSLPAPTSTLPPTITTTPPSTSTSSTSTATVPVRKTKEERISMINGIMEQHRQEIKHLHVTVQKSEKVNIYTNYDRAVLASKINEEKLQTSIPYYKLHPAAVSGKVSDGETTTKDDNGKFSTVKVYYLTWEYTQFINGKPSITDLIVQLPEVELPGLLSKPMTSYTKDHKPITNQTWTTTIKLFPSNPEHMLFREKMEDLHLGMANVLLPHKANFAGNKGANAEFDVNKPTRTLLQSLLFFFKNVEVEKYHEAICNMQVRLINTSQQKSIFIMPPEIAKKLGFSDLIAPWHKIEKLMIRCIPSIRIKYQSSVNSIRFELVNAVITNLTKQVGLDDAEKAMEEIYAQNPEIMESFMNSANALEEDIKNIPDKIENKAPSTTATGANIVSDPSKLDASIAAMMGAGGGGQYPPPLALPAAGMPQQFMPPQMSQQQYQGGMQQQMPPQMQQYPPQGQYPTQAQYPPQGQYPPPQQTNFAAPQTGPVMDNFSYPGGMQGGGGQSYAQTYMPTQK